MIRTSLVLDSEIKDHYWLTIQAEKFPLSSITHIFIRVLNVNDNAPMPMRPVYFASVPENSPENTVVVKVNCHFFVR